jgi:hypothetical protein
MGTGTVTVRPCRHDLGLRPVVCSPRVLAEALTRHCCGRRALPPAGHDGAKPRGQLVRLARRSRVRDASRPGPRAARSSSRAAFACYRPDHRPQVAAQL